MTTFLLLALLAQPSVAQRRDAVLSTRGLVAFWDFTARDAQGRFVAHTGKRTPPGYPLEARNIARDYWNDGRPATYDDFPLLPRGPFGQAVRIAPAASAQLRPTLMVPREALHDTPLDIKGPGQSVSMVVWLIREGGNHAIAGIWHEGTDISPAEDRAARIETGRRQFALFAGLAANSGGASAHVSENGVSSFGDRYARNLSVTPEIIPVDGSWSVVGFTFDNRRNQVTSYLNGKATENWLENPARHPFYRYPYKGWLQAHLARLPGVQEGEDPRYPADQRYTPPENKVRAERVESETAGERVVVRTFDYTRVRLVYRKDARGKWREASRDLVALKVNPFWFAHDLFAPRQPADGGPFTIGRVIHSRRGDGMTGSYGGVAVFRRALPPREMERLARIAASGPLPAPK